MDRLYGLEGSVDRKALWIGRLYGSEDSTDRSASGSDVGLVRNSPTPIAWFVEACFSPGCVDPVFHREGTSPFGRGQQKSNQKYFGTFIGNGHFCEWLSTRQNETKFSRACWEHGSRLLRTWSLSSLSLYQLPNTFLTLNMYSQFWLHRVIVTQSMIWIHVNTTSLRTNFQSPDL